MRFLQALVLLCFSMLGAPAFGTPASGTLSVITYNVAGLPEGLARTNPARTHPLIGERLSRYDLALVQEDFAYAELLRRELRLPYQSRPFVRGDRYDFGDGLSVFSRYPFGELERVPWATCHGFTSHFFDCLTPKGFSVATLTLAEGVLLDVYDVHLDAGSSSGDRDARTAQLDQLAAAIQARSSGRALLVGGDFNLRADEREKLYRFERATGLSDACKTLRCPQPARLDRLLYRATPDLEVRPVRWRIAPGFRDPGGAPLSDHAPVSVDFGWRSRQNLR